MNPTEFTSKVIDLCVEFDIIEDYELEIHENVVIHCEIYLQEGFINIYRNFETGKIAYAWIKNEERIYGADNTGGWHLHPYGRSSKHQKTEPVPLKDFLKNVENILKSKKDM
ncbi:MAG: hypothetical protein V5A88_09755 [Candidatus Thermoplasmatota archaeon]